jgi:hypothetical protein
LELRNLVHLEHFTNLSRTNPFIGTASVTLSVGSPKALFPILIGAFTAGFLDLTCAFVFYGVGVPRVIAAGLLGLEALKGGWAIYTLGVALQFSIAVAATATYHAASLKLEFLKDHAFVCGLFYGIAVFLVMNLIVLPLSALHATGPFQLGELIQGLLVHMFCIGLPISFSLRLYPI